MSLFGYPADIVHYQAILDSWNRVTGYNQLYKKAKVVEEQKLIRNEKGEDIISVGEIHLEGVQDVKPQDYFLYTNALNIEIRYDIKHIEIKKQMGNDDVKKVIVYG